MLQFGVTNATGVSINISPLNREFIKIMGLNARSKIAMANLSRSSVYSLIILALLGVLMGFGQATTTNFTVKGGEEVTCPINLLVEDRVLIQFKVVGETANTLHFSISFPNATVRDFGESGDFSYSFICDVEGEYGLRFMNNDQTENKLVTLNYEVQHYIFGIPQMLFLTIIIVLACIGGVAAFVLMGRPYR
jgi:hypothetical protein